MTRKHEFTSLTTYLNDQGVLVVMDADGAIRDERVDVTAELGRLRGLGWQVVDVDTSESEVVDDGAEQRVLMTSYLLEREASDSAGGGL